MNGNSSALAMLLIVLCCGCGDSGGFCNNQCLALLLIILCCGGGCQGNGSLNDSTVTSVL